MEKLLFESTGGSQKNERSRLISCIVLIVIAAILYGISQVKVSSTRTGGIQTIGNTTYFSLGKAYVFNEKAQIAMIIVAAGIIIFSVVMMIFILRKKGSSKTFLKIYENHIESSQYDGLAQRKFDITFDEIVNVDVSSALGVNVISIKTQRRNYTITLDKKDAEKAYAIIIKQWRNGR